MAYDFNPFKKNVASAEEWLKKEFQQIRTGQASPAVLDGVKVDDRHGGGGGGAREAPPARMGGRHE